MSDSAEKRPVCRKDLVEREQIIAKYLSRTLDSKAVEEFEAHYLVCSRCFCQLQVSESLAVGLQVSSPGWRRTSTGVIPGSVATAPTQRKRQSGTRFEQEIVARASSKLACRSGNTQEFALKRRPGVGRRTASISARPQSRHRK